MLSNEIVLSGLRSYLTTLRKNARYIHYMNSNKELKLAATRFILHTILLLLYITVTMSAIIDVVSTDR